MPAAPVSGQEMIEGQLNAEERRILTEAIRNAPQPPRTLVEVGTWLGGGSTLHILRAMQANGVGHLWGIEAHREMYERMIANLRAAAPDALDRFTPLFGFSEKVIPRWLAELPTGTGVDFVFLDGGDNPREQLAEFQLLDPHIPVGGQLLAHDAKIRKGKWLGPFLRALDHWETTLHDVSDEGLLHAIKRAVHAFTGKGPFALEQAVLARVQMPSHVSTHDAQVNALHRFVWWADTRHEDGSAVRKADAGALNRGRQLVIAFHAVDVPGEIRFLIETQALFAGVTGHPAEKLHPLVVKPRIVNIGHTLNLSHLERKFTGLTRLVRHVGENS